MVDMSSSASQLLIGARQQEVTGAVSGERSPDQALGMMLTMTV
jgi:hypothetical protein